MASISRNPIQFQICTRVRSTCTDFLLQLGFFKLEVLPIPKLMVKCFNNQSRQIRTNFTAIEKKINRKAGKEEHHLYITRDSAASGQKAFNFVRIVCGLPTEKEAVYGELDKWVAWETEFPIMAVSKALQILKKKNQWKRVIQVAKWMFGKGQGMTMGAFDILLEAFDMEQRVDEAESLWNMILHTHTRSISKRLFSRIISLYAHHSMPEKIIEVFGDMEELSVKPDADTVRKIAFAFKKVRQEDKMKLFLKKYQMRWKYIHFSGERVRLKNNPLD